MILHDTVVTGLPVDEVIDWADEKPDRIDEMFLRGLVPQFPADAARIYGNGSSLGELFKTRKAAVRAYQNAGFKMQLSSEGEVVPKPLYILLIRKWALPPRGVRYQPTGKGQQSRFALFNPEKFPDIRATLEKALGSLAAFEVLPAPAEPELEASPPLVPDPEIRPRRHPKPIQGFGTNKGNAAEGYPPCSH
jgi:hypothetical protein